MKINYSGAPFKREWQYVCNNCNMFTVLRHTAEDDMSHRKCPHCSETMHRYIDGAPLMDADYHEAHKARNIGWDS